MRGFLKQMIVAATAAGLASSAGLAPGLMAVPSISGDTATPFSGVPSPIGPARPQSAEAPDTPNANPPVEPRSSVLPQDIPPPAANGVITPRATIDPKITTPPPSPPPSATTSKNIIIPPAQLPDNGVHSNAPATKGDTSMSIPPPGTPGGRPAPVPK